MEYLVIVSVYQAAGLTLGEGNADNPSPYIIVKVFDETHQTNVVEDASTCAFGHSFSISKHAKQEELEASDVEVIVMHYKGFGRTQELGHCIFSLQKVRRQQNNVVLKDWFPCVKKGEPAVTLGFVQLSIGAYSPKDVVPRSFGGADGDDGEGQSMRSRVIQLPTASNLKDLYQLMVRVYRAEDLRTVSGVIRDGCDPFVQVDFYGTTQRTEIQKGSTTPNWNEEIRVPFQRPCWDNSINVYLKSSGMSEEEIGETCLHLDELLDRADREMPPTWFNFYHVPKEASDLGMSAAFTGKIEMPASAFAGRLLLSASVEPSKNPTLSKQPAPTPRDPAALESVIWADLYEVCLDLTADKMPKEVWISLSIGAGQEIKTEPEDAETHGMAFIWDTEKGRLEQETSLVDKEMCPDVIVSVHGHFPGLVSWSEERHMFTRIKAADVWNWDAQPKWYEFELVQGCANAEQKGGFALLSINIGRQSDLPKQRPPKEKIELRDFNFRAKLYQAVDLPWKATEGGSHPYVVMFFGTAVLASDIVPWTINPTFNQLLESTVQLPAEAKFRPEIIVYVLNRLETGVDALCMYRYKTSERGALPEVWKGPPIWLDLEPMPGGQPVHGRLLVAFELTSAPAAATPRGSRGSDGSKSVEGGSGSRRSALKVETVDCKVDFYAMGIRMWELGILKSVPELQIMWGRQEEDRDEALKEKWIPIENKTAEGCEGEYNFKQRVGMSCKLPKDPLYQDWLEVRVFDEKLVAFSGVHLNPLMPWHTAEQRMELAESFEIHMQQEAAEEGDVSSGDDKDAHAGVGLWRQAKDLLKHQEKYLCHSMGWDKPSCEASNIRKVDWVEYFNLNEEEDEKGDEHELRRRPSASKFKDGAASSAVEDGDLRPSGGDMEGYTDVFADFSENFAWPTGSVGQCSLDKHPDLDSDFEHAMLQQQQELPYHRAPIYVGTEWGEPRQVGVLKYCLRIAEKAKTASKDPATMAAAAAFDDKIKDLETTMGQCKDLVVRAYVLSADGLIPHSGSSDVTTFVQTRVEKEGKTAHTRHDSKNERFHTIHPQFNMCHDFYHCHFPGNCILEHTIFEKPAAGLLGGGGGEEPIGHTQLDLEDRWFSQRYRDLVKADIVPIESRRLSHQASCFGKGHLRVWIDILTPEQSGARKPAKLPETKPEPFQLRVVIWKVRHINASFKDGETSADIFVQGKHTLDDKTPLVQRTDTHLNANDGIGTFNWRFVYDIKIPCRNPQLVVSVINDGYFDDDPIGEVTFDFMRDFSEARKGDCSVKVERSFVQLSHASFPGEVRGELEIEAKVVPNEEAIMEPVGLGRDEPNTDPFLDPEDPHLKAHRSLIGNLAIVQNIAALGNGLLMMGKYMLILKIAAGVLSGLGGAVFVIAQAKQAFG